MEAAAAKLIGAGLAAIGGFVFLASFGVWLVLKAVSGIRVSEAEELEGVDLSECGMLAYPEFVSGSFAAGGAAGGTAEKRDEPRPAASFAPATATTN